MPHFCHKAYFTVAASSWLKILAFSVGFLHLPRKNLKHAKLLHGAWLKETPPKNGKDTKNISDVQESFTTSLPAPKTDEKAKVFRFIDVFNTFILKNLFLIAKNRSWRFLRAGDIIKDHDLGDLSFEIAGVALGLTTQCEVLVVDVTIPS